MIRKGHQPAYEVSSSHMRRVLALIADGVVDREAMAQQLGITRNQVRSAIGNLKAAGLIEASKHDFKGYCKGRGFSEYKLAPDPNTDRPVLSGCSFIFWAAR